MWLSLYPLCRSRSPAALIGPGPTRTRVRGASRDLARDRVIDEGPTRTRVRGAPGGPG
jgi:hypothetical protein